MKAYNIRSREFGSALLSAAQYFDSKPEAMRAARMVAQSGGVAVVSKHGAGVRVATIYPEVTE